MISDDDLKKIEGTSKCGHWYVHNGFLGWAYGSPLNPTPISRSTAKIFFKELSAVDTLMQYLGYLYFPTHLIMPMLEILFLLLLAGIA